MLYFVIKNESEMFFISLFIDSYIERTIENGKDLHRKNERRLQT